MGETIRTLRNEGQDPHQVVPHLVAAYQVALQYQHYIVEQNNEALQRAVTGASHGLKFQVRLKDGFAGARSLWDTLAGFARKPLARTLGFRFHCG